MLYNYYAKDKGVGAEADSAMEAVPAGECHWSVPIPGKGRIDVISVSSSHPLIEKYSVLSQMLEWVRMNGDSQLSCFASFYHPEEKV